MTVGPGVRLGPDEVLVLIGAGGMGQDRRRSPDTGREHGFDILEAPDWVNVVALTAAGRVVLIRQFRAGTEEITTEIPGGTVDGDEAPEQAAARELEEETGYRSSDWSLIGRVDPNPAFQTNTTWTFLSEAFRRSARARSAPVSNTRS